MKNDFIKSRFMAALKKTHTNWEKDTELTEILRKMEQGIDFEKEELNKVYFILRESRQ